MKTLTDNEIIELLKISSKLVLVASIVLILIGILGFVLQLTTAKTKNFKTIMLSPIFLVIFGGIGIAMMIAYVSSIGSEKNFSVSYGYIESKDWKYENSADHDSLAKQYYARVKGLRGKANLSEEEYNSLEEGDKVIIVYQKDRLRLIFDPEEYEYDGEHWVD